jgi:hypothetical protein
MVMQINSVQLNQSVVQGPTHCVHSGDLNVFSSVKFGFFIYARIPETINFTNCRKFNGICLINKQSIR